MKTFKRYKIETEGEVTKVTVERVGSSGIVSTHVYTPGWNSLFNVQRLLWDVRPYIHVYRGSIVVTFTGDLK